MLDDKVERHDWIIAYIDNVSSKTTQFRRQLEKKEK